MCHCALHTLLVTEKLRLHVELASHGQPCSPAYCLRTGRESLGEEAALQACRLLRKFTANAQMAVTAAHL